MSLGDILKNISSGAIHTAGAAVAETVSQIAPTDAENVLARLDVLNQFGNSSYQEGRQNAAEVINHVAHRHASIFGNVENFIKKGVDSIEEITLDMSEKFHDGYTRLAADLARMGEMIDENLYKALTGINDMGEKLLDMGEGFLDEVSDTAENFIEDVGEFFDGK